MNMKMNDHKKNLSRATGARKIQAFFEELVLKDFFQEEVRQIRKKYDIPEDGFQIITDIPCENCNHAEHEQTLPPKNWVGLSDDGVREAFDKDLEKVEDRFGLLGPHFFTPLSIYIFYNIVFSPDFSPWQLCFIEDKKGNVSKEFEIRMNQSHPICIRISPYASSSDIVAFVNATYSSYIKPLQKRDRKNGFSIGGVKTKNSEISERDSYILSLEKMPIKSISKKLIEKYGPNSKHSLDEGSIGKILSLQRKKRKDS